MKQNPRVLFYDIETSPNIGYTWGKYEQNVIDFKKEWGLLSFAYKWQGKAHIQCDTLLDFGGNEKRLAMSLRTVLAQADVIVAHNGKQFDNKKANAKFIQHGLKPLPPIPTIDTLELARRHFQFNSNKLDDLGKLLGLGRKFKIPEGFELWIKCMAGDPKAFKTLARYNKQDVILLEKVYIKLRPWIKHPNLRLDGCQKCGSYKMQARGVRRTLVSVFQRFQCLLCGGWSQFSIKTKATKPRFISL